MIQRGKEYTGTVSASVLQADRLHMPSGSRVSGSLIPLVTDNPGHSLGSPDIPWKDAYLSSGSLYIDNQRALFIESGSLALKNDIRIGGFAVLNELIDLQDRLDTLSQRFESLSGSVSRSQGGGGGGSPP